MVMGLLRKNRSLKRHANAQGCRTRHDRALRRENGENGLGIVALARPEIFKSVRGEIFLTQLQLTQRFASKRNVVTSEL
jgi:hypothetical protein